jgi:uncharacterized membrane protein YcaP (DUF421 family)
MESILRGAAVYVFVWLIFRVAGKRSLAQITTFDTVLLLIISETTQGALLDNDNSLTNCCLLILVMLGMDVLFSYIKQWFPKLEKVIDGTPCLLIDRGQLQQRCMDMERVDQNDILHAARECQGIANLSEIEYAILEKSGGITIVPGRRNGNS